MTGRRTTPEPMHYGRPLDAPSEFAEGGGDALDPAGDGVGKDDFEIDRISHKFASCYTGSCR